MRVVYDISNLGLGHFYRESRGGGFRVDIHVAEGLAASPDCELLFCANHSAVAFHGCQAFLRAHPRLGAVPLVGPSKKVGGAIRIAARSAHRSIRRLVGTNVFPAALRGLAGVVDRRLHPPVTNLAGRADILHSPTTALPPRSNGPSPRRFLTIYDVAPLRFPEIYAEAYRRSLRRIIDSLQADDHVITCSNFTRQELLAEGVATADRIHVVPLAADPALFYRCDDVHRITAVRRKYAIPEGPYILGVNTPDLRKNVPHAIHAFARAAHDAHAVSLALVLTGLPGNGSDRISKAMARYPGLRDRIVLTGYIPDDDLAPLYSGACALVYPSIYEGFGLPPLEAMRCGIPVIASNTSSLPEVVGDGGVLVSPGDLDALAGAMVDAAGDTGHDGVRRARAAAQAERFTWNRSIAALLQAYRQALAA